MTYNELTGETVFKKNEQGAAGGRCRHCRRDEHGGPAVDAGAAGGCEARLPSGDGGGPRSAALRWPRQRAVGSAALTTQWPAVVPDGGVPSGGASRHHPQCPRRQQRLVPRSSGSGQNDFFFLRRRAPDRLVQTVVDLCHTRLPRTTWGSPPIRSRCSSPTRPGPYRHRCA